jgi:hypothetical protein
LLTHHHYYHHYFHHHHHRRRRRRRYHHHVRIQTGAAALSKAAPNLEALDAGFSCWNMRPGADELLDLASLLPKLKAIGFILNSQAGLSRSAAL